MTRDIIGGIVVLVVVILFVAAYLRAQKGRDRSSIILILAAGFLLRAFTGSDLFLHEWDERYHSLVAKHLVANPLTPTLYEDPLLPYDFKHWTANHVWLHKEPLALWSMAFSMSVFGFNEIALRLPSILFSTLGILITFLIGREFGGARIGLIAAFLHAVNGYLIELAAGRIPTDHVDTLFIALIGLGVLIAVKSGPGNPWRGAVLMGLVTGLAALTKSAVSLTLVILWASMIWNRSRCGCPAVAGRVMLAVAVAAVVYLPWHFYIGQAFPAEAAWERSYNVRHLTVALEGHDGGPLYHLWRIPRYFGELAYLSIGWFFLFRLRFRLSDRKQIALALWLVIPYGFFSLATTKMPGYVMIAAPAVFIMLALHFQHLKEVAGAARGWRRFGAMAIMTLLLALPVRFGLERVKPMWGPGWETEWSRLYRGIGRQFQGDRAVVYNVERPIELMFYSSVLAYERIPSAEEVALSESKGYRVAILDHGDIPLWIQNHPRIVQVQTTSDLR